MIIGVLKGHIAYRALYQEASTAGLSKTIIKENPEGKTWRKKTKKTGSSSQDFLKLNYMFSVSRVVGWVGLRASSSDNFRANLGAKSKSLENCWGYVSIII